MNPTPDLDPVEVLRQRVAAAMRGHVAALGMGSPGTDLTEALGVFEAELDDSDPAHPAVQAVARALVGMDADATTSTEWSTARDDEDLTGARPLMTRESAMAALQSGCGHQLVARTVTYRPWQVVNTEGGE